MKVDYISDLHIGFDVSSKMHNQRKTKKTIAKVVASLLPDEPGDVLVIAGDISEYNWLSIETLKVFKLYYPMVFFVPGNHDYYLTTKSQLKKYNFYSEARINELIKHFMFDNQVIVLSNSTFFYHGIKFSGTPFWYQLTEDDEQSFKTDSNDSRFLHPKPFGYANNLIDKRFFEQNYDYCDVFITHVPPIYVADDKPVSYYYNIKSFNPAVKTKHWICGHQHVTHEQQYKGLTIHMNARGYPGEIENPKIRQFEI